MSFLTAAALAVGLLVMAPVIAHLLRRKPPEEVPFTAVKLVPVTPAIAQRRTALEDRALFFVRASAVLALAILGATPFVTCQRLSLARQGGASVAITIVLDDSLSMRAPPETEGEATTRFARAKEAAQELLLGLQEGDAVAVVMAGDPPRVGLAATTNLDAAREAIDAAQPSDRGTDLEAAVKLAGELMRELSHVDKRVVVLSDLADGGPTAKALEAPEGMKIWVPLKELQGLADDCAVVGAERHGRRISVRVACGPEPEGSAQTDKRRLQVLAGRETLVEVPIRRVEGPQDITVTLPDGANLDTSIQLYVALIGGDAIAADDVAPVVTIGGKLRVGVATDATESAVATGGPPPVEQAFSALQLGVQIRPLSTVPDRASDLDDVGLLVVDDVPGFTPSQRRELEGWVQRGGVLLLTLGPGAASAPIGQGFAPMVPGLIRWRKDPPKGIDRAQDQLFTEAGSGLEDLAPVGRAELELEPDDEVKVLVAWSDGRPFAIEHRMGRGVVIALTLPFDTHQSDFALRPGFLELLKRVTDTARTLGGVSRSTAGTAWALQGFDEVKVFRLSRNDEKTPLDVELTPGGKTRRVVPELAGLYLLQLDGNEATRVAAVSEAEVDLRPRPAAPGQHGEELGGVEASVDISSYIALALLALILLEMVIRVSGRSRRSEGATDTPVTEAA